MAGPNEVAKAHVTIEGDISGLKESVQDAKKTVSEVGDAADNAGSRVDGAFTKAGEKIEESTKGVRKFVGALSSVAGVATGLIGVVGLLAGAFAGLTAILKKLNDGGEESISKTRTNLQGLFDDVSGANVSADMFPVFLQLQQDIEEVGEKVIKLRQQVAATIEGGQDPDAELIFGIKNVGPKLEEAEQKLAKLLEQRSALTSRAREVGEAVGEQMGDAMVSSFRSAAEGRDSVLSNLQSQAESMRVSLIGDDGQRIKAEADLAIEQINRIRKEAGISSDNSVLTEYVALIRRGEEEKLKALEERIAKERQADAEREAEKDRRSLERVQREMDAIRRGLDSITSGDFVATLEAIPRALREVSTGVRRLK